MELLKKSAGLVIGGAVALAVLVSAISWFQMAPQDRSAVLSVTGRALAWLGIVLVLPWATYFATTATARRDSNAAGGLLVGAYTLVDGLILAWLLQFTMPQSATAVVLVVLGLLVALAYNLLVCDWIAERLA